jgi:hypothetical protein
MIANTSGFSPEVRLSCPFQSFSNCRFKMRRLPAAPSETKVRAEQEEKIAREVRAYVS